MSGEVADHGTTDLQAADILPPCPQVPGVTTTCTCGRVYTSRLTYGRTCWSRIERAEPRGDG